MWKVELLDADDNVCGLAFFQTQEQLSAFADVHRFMHCKSPEYIDAEQVVLATMVLASGAVAA